jgi:hypothetical protein
LDRIRQNYNIGAIFRLCDTFLIERLVIAGTAVDLRKRQLTQAPLGTQHWVPWESADSAVSVVAAAQNGAEEVGHLFVARDCFGRVVGPDGQLEVGGDGNVQADVALRVSARRALRKRACLRLRTVAITRARSGVRLAPCEARRGSRKDRRRAASSAISRSLRMSGSDML